MITILRLSHRLPRDERITTHVALVGRAFGADSLVYSGDKDESFERSIAEVCKKWGGNFPVSYVPDAIKWLKEKKKKAKIVHLTMYGLPISEKEENISQWAKEGELILVIGSEKVPCEIYEIADLNLSVTLQPHSEVAALAIALDRIMRGEELTREFDKRFKGIKIVPQARGKKLVKEE